MVPVGSITATVSIVPIGSTSGSNHVRSPYRNFDLAQVLRRAGYASLVFHYRGSRGVGGSWSWGHVLEDTAAVVAALPGLAAAHRLDPGRLVLIGSSPPTTRCRTIA